MLPEVYGGYPQAKLPDSDPPKGFDWDQWLGPAPERPYNAQVHRNWHGWWDFSGGNSSDGIHQLDLARMLLGEPPFTGPTAQAVIAKRFVAPIPKVRATRDVPEMVDDAITRALARTPVDRFPTAAEFAEALVPGRRTPPEAPKGAPPTKAVAVIPLANMSADPENEYFSDGMTEEIINALAKVPGIQVASRTSSFAFKGKEVDIRQIGDKLGVGSVLDGSVRKVGNRIRITVQLINVENGYHIWSETYDRQLEDVFAIQDEISRAIVEALKLRLGGEAAPLVVPTKNIEAYNLYLKGRFFFNKFNEPAIRKSLDFYQHVLLQDPGFARAYAGIADCWTELADDWIAPEEAYPRAKAAAKRALEYDPQLVEAMTSLGKVLAWYEWDFPEAERTLRKAVSLNPNDAEATWSFGSILPTVGKLGEAIIEMRRAVTLNPVFPRASRWLSRFLLYAGDYAEAIVQSQKALELDNEYFQSYHDAGSATLAMGDAEARTALVENPAITIDGCKLACATKMVQECGGTVSREFAVLEVYRRYRDFKPQGIGELNEGGQKLAEALAKEVDVVVDELTGAGGKHD